VLLGVFSVFEIGIGYICTRCGQRLWVLWLKNLVG
jgi:hypothetical protein